MSQPFWKRYGTMDEFIKAVLLRMNEIGISQTLIPDTTNSYSLGSSSKQWRNIYIDEGGWIDVLAVEDAIFLKKIISKTTTYTATGLNTIILVDTSGAAWTLTLPAAASSTGQVLIIKKTDVSANALTIDGNAAETIDGAATNAEIDAQYDCLIIVCDGTGWHIIGRWIH